MNRTRWSIEQMFADVLRIWTLRAAIWNRPELAIAALGRDYC